MLAAAIFVHGTCDWPWQLSLQQEACSTRVRVSAEHDGPHGASVVAEAGAEWRSQALRTAADMTVAAVAAAQEMEYECLRTGRARGGHVVSEKPGCECLPWRIAMGLCCT